MADILYKSITKMALAILLLIGLFNLAPQYYRITDIAVFSLMVITAALYLEDKKYVAVALSVIGAIVFNPIFKIPFTHDAWHIIYEVTAIVLIIWTVVEFASFLYRRPSRKS
jgi:hypothetical protein